MILGVSILQNKRTKTKTQITTICDKKALPLKHSAVKNVHGIDISKNLKWLFNNVFNTDSILINHRNIFVVVLKNNNLKTLIEPHVICSFESVE